MKTKVEVLKEATSRLKEEYVGIDQQIDQIIEQITPWYLTPELLTRPQVISLFSMTGTGKTSVVRKLLSYLGVIHQIYIDCSKISSNHGGEDLGWIIKEASIGDYGNGDYNPFSKESENNGRSFAIVFDEFQHCRTIDENGKEIDRPNCSEIWNLIDSGIVDCREWNYSMEKLKKTIDGLISLSKAYPNIELNRLVVKNNRDILSKDYWFSYYILHNSERDKELEERDWRIFDSNECNEISESLEDAKKGYGREVLNRLYQCTSLTELIEVLYSCREVLFRPKLINCSKSLIFIIGNIDEAYSGYYDDLSPDINADTLRKLTKNISIPTIKEALTSRFRIEQLSRLGNNIITYPTLGIKDFKRIIDIELDKVKKLIKIPIKFDHSIKDLIYSEGVYPSQGARPLLSTVYNIVFPRLSDIIIQGEGKVTSAEISSEELNEEYSLIISKLYEGDSLIKELSYKFKLILGSLRNNKNARLAEILAIHEAGHAVVYSRLTGHIPDNIVGFTATQEGLVTENYRTVEYLSTKRDVDSTVKRLLAGYLAERLFIENPEDRSFGSSSDLKKAWSIFSKIVYTEGYFDDASIFSAEPRRATTDGIPFGKSDKYYLDDLCDERFDTLQEETKLLLKEEKTLIKEVAKYLVEHRIMPSEVFEDYISKYATGFSLESMKKIREEQSYLNVI